MTKDEQSYLKMSVTEESNLLNNLSICGSLPGFTNYHTVIQDCNTKIKDAAVREESGRFLDTLTKKQLREMLVDECSDIIRKMYAYAVNENLNDLIKGLTYSHTFLKKTSEGKLNSICSSVLEQANKHQANLNNYGITSATITKLQQTASDFDALLPKTEQEKTELKENRQQLKQLFAILRTNWSKMDNIIEILRLDHPDFYYKYHDLRKPDSIKSSSIDLSVKMYDKQSGQAVSMVNLSLMPTASLEQERFEANASIIKNQTKMYGCFFKNLSEGNYIITASKAGYRETTKEITIIKGEYTAVNIVMEKL
ncbi:MAG: carboxypeptidase-like regulatory domain-containing protein [Bacteroidetes bacterium]|nr:carboxypeptidase-like regulatory domain-containing protein [Bacteroidota bacterium]